MITRGSDDITWTSFDKPKKIESGSDYTEFTYGPDRARYRQDRHESGSTTVIRYVSSLFEFEDPASGNNLYRHYVQAGEGVIAMVEREDTGSPGNVRQYLHRDNQGSVTKVTDASGNVDQAMAFDAWGLRRDPTDWSALASPFAGTNETERGYTGHEHLDTVGLIHMNGRVQDPVLGRFISADPLVQAPFNTQSHNRYSYVWNNPTSYTDPSGFNCEDATGPCEDDGTFVFTAGECVGMCQIYRMYGAVWGGLDAIWSRMGVDGAFMDEFMADLHSLGADTQAQHESFVNSRAGGAGIGSAGVPIGETVIRELAPLAENIPSDGFIEQVIEGAASTPRGLARLARHEARLQGHHGVGQQVQAGVIEQRLLGEGLELALGSNRTAIVAGQEVGSIVLRNNAARLASRQASGLAIGFVVGGPSVNIAASFGDAYHAIEQLASSNQIFITTVDANRPILPQLPEQQRERLTRELGQIMDVALTGLD